MLLRFVLPLMATEFFSQLGFWIIRITTAYRIVDLGLGSVWLGIVTVIFAVPALVMAVKFGRYVDRGNDLEAAWLGAALQLLAAFGLVLSDSLPMLLLGTAVLGTGNFLLALSFQMLCARYGKPGGLHRLLGTYMLVGAVSQAIGPIVIAWVGGSAAIPPIHFLFSIAAGIIVLGGVCVLTIRPGREPKTITPAANRVPISKIVRLPGLATIFMISIMTSTSQDLLGVYLPLFGAERGLGVDAVGTLLAVRAAASMTSRILFDRVYRIVGIRPVLVGSTLANAVAFLLLFLPLPIPVLYVLLAIAGLAAGFGMTGSIASALSLPLETRGTANSLRMMGNRAGQTVVPFTAGLVAAATGVAGVFLLMGIALSGVWGVVQFRAKDLR